MKKMVEKGQKKTLLFEGLFEDFLSLFYRFLRVFTGFLRVSAKPWYTPKMLEIVPHKFKPPVKKCKVPMFPVVHEN